MKKLLVILLSLVALCSILISGCSEAATQTSSTAVSSAPAGTTAAAAAKPIKIAVIGQESGAVKTLADNTRVGAQLAAYEANQAGGVLNGSQIEIREYDEGYTSEVVLKSVKQAIADGCVAITGFVDASQALPAVEYCKEQGIPVAVGFSGVDKKLVPGYYDGLWRCSQVVKAFSLGLADWLDEQGYTNLVTVQWTGDFSKEVDAWTKYAIDQGMVDNLQLVDEIWYNWGQVDLTAEITKAVNDNPDVILTGASSTESIIPILERLDELNYQGQLVTMITTLDDWVVVQDGGELVDGVISYSGFQPDSEIPASIEFSEAFTQYTTANNIAITHGGSYSVSGYVAVKSIIEGIKQAGSADPAEIIKGVQASSWETPYGVDFNLLEGGRLYCPYLYIVKASAGEVVVVNKIKLSESDYGEPYTPPEGY